MTYSQIITLARRQLNDEDASAYRWPDATLTKYLGIAQAKALELRPDLTLLSSAALATVPVVASGATVLTALEPYDVAMADYVAYRALIEDSDDNTKQANLYLQNFMFALTGTGGGK